MNIDFSDGNEETLVNMSFKNVCFKKYLPVLQKRLQFALENVLLMEEAYTNFGKLFTELFYLVDFREQLN